MGEIVSVAVSVTKMVDKPVDVIKESIINSIRNNKSLSENLVVDMATSFTSDVEAYVNYAEKYVPDTLTQNFFSIEAPTTDEQFDEVKRIIELEIGQEIVISNLDLATTNLNFFAEEWLVSQPQIFWDDLKTNFNIDQFSIEWRIGQSYYISSSPFLHIDLVVTDFTINFNSPSVLITTIITDITFKDPDDSYYFVRYVIKDSVIVLNNQTFDLNSLIGNFIGGDFWYYRLKDNTYPTLNNITNIILKNSPLPVAGIRRDKTNIVDMVNSDAILVDTTRTLLKKINIDLDEFTDNLNDPNDPGNLDNVEEVFIIFAMDVNSQEQISLEYLYEHFKQQHYLDPQDVFGISLGIRTQQDWLDVKEFGIVPNINTINSPSFHATFFHNFTTLQIQNGLVTNSNLAPDPLIIIPFVIGIDDNNVGNGLVTSQIILGSEPSEHRIIYRKQLTTVAAGDASNTFAELMVHGLTVSYAVFDPDRSVRTSSYIPPKSFLRDLSDISNGDLLVPVIFSYAKLFNSAEETAIYYESLRTVVYAFEIQNIGFFQSGFFKALITVIIIVVSVILNQEAIGAAIIAGLGAVAKLLILTLVIGFVITKTLTLLVKTIGGKLAFLLAIVLAAASLYYGKTDTLFTLFDAEISLSMVTTSLIGAIGEVTGNRILKLIEENEDFIQTAKEEQEKIDAANDLLDNGTTLELYDLIRTPIYVNFNEGPDAFFNRTIHNMNPGANTLDVIESYVDMALTLPEPQFI